MADRIRVVLADDHPVLRHGTAELLQRETDLEVVGEASDGVEAVALAHDLLPDVVVMDVRMPRLSGIEATQQIRDSVAGVRVLVLTAHDDSQYVFSLLQAGANGYLLKSAPVSEVVRAIREVHEGNMPLDPSITSKLVSQVAEDRETRRAPGVVEGGAARLTPREFEVLQFLARGLTNRAIAHQLSISDRTVQAHLTSVFAKMGVGSRVEAVLEAIRRGWLTLQP